MQQNKLLWFLVGLLFAFAMVILVLFYKNEVIKARLYASERSESFLILNRNLEIFKGLEEKDITIIRKNLDLYLMFGLKPIEIDGIKQHLNIESSKKLLCNKYKNIWASFIAYNKLKYPSAMIDLSELCRQKN